MIDIVPIPAFRDNYIWAICRGDEVVVVDPGDDAPVRKFLAGRRLAAILVTHHHADHVGGVAVLGGRNPVFGPGAESITGVSEPLSGGEQITLPGVGVELRVLAVPGHTRGHIAYYGEGALFCGDTLFGAGCGRLFEGTPEQMHRSLKAFDTLPDDTLVYCAHEYTMQNLRFAVRVEPDNADIAARVARCNAARERGEPTVPSTLGEERRTNPFLRSEEAAVIRAAQARGAGSEPVEVFAAIRAWRDEF
ncbi:MAG TPA: hydroxyacylglutathione hydrolase [Rhodocyclaceae bacterium]